MLDMSEEKEIVWCGIMRVGWVYGQPQSVFHAKSPTLSSYVESGIVCMNNEFSPIDLRVERKQSREKIITVVLGLENPAFRKRGEHGKSRCIPCNRQHRFSVFRLMSWLFGWLLFWAKPDMLMICRKIEPGFIKCDDELPSVMFDGTELGQ
jgi:hypothetical protein